ncbi:uncharacterized protein [Littorina saxatilis]|uniref:uncharacterized protein isoform X2 n=1 Tax=Littorina saxatilis TaxID=31220 RepID=UPI0038B5A342
MSRGVRDLRDLVCVSRLTYRDSDEEDEIWSDEEVVKRDLSGLQLSDGSTSPASRSSSAGTNPPVRLRSSDSVFVTNGSPVDKSDSTVTVSLEDAAELSSGSSSSTVKSKSKSKPSKRKRKKKAMQLMPQQFELPKSAVLPPVSVDRFLFAQEPSPPDSRYRAVGASVGAGDGQTKRGDFDPMLAYMDATIVAEWLTRSNTALEDLTTYCNQGDNFVQFAHFWLLDFPETQKQEIYEMEYEILVEEVGLAFAVGKESRKVVRRDVTDLVSALFREYPTKLFSSRGSVLFLDHLDILTSERAERYKKLLSDVRCSTKNRQYAQWLLATRSFALVNMWGAVINFYRNMLGQHGIPPGLPVPVLGSSGDNVYQRRLAQAVRLGFPDVVHYLISGGHVDVTKSDVHGRSLLFSAIMHNQPKVVHYLVTRGMER